MVTGCVSHAFMTFRHRPAAQQPDGQSREDDTASVDWATAINYYGCAQVFGLGLPVLWLAFQSPTDPYLRGAATLTSCYVAAVALATGRKRILAGEEWPTLTTRRLGTGVGYWSYLRRHTLIAATLALGIFGSIVVGQVGGIVATTVTAGVVTVGAVALIPRLSAPDDSAHVSRTVFYAAGLAATAHVARPLAFSVAVTSAPITFLFLVTGAIVDILWAPPEADPRD